MSPIVYYEYKDQERWWYTSEQEVRWWTLLTLVQKMRLLLDVKCCSTKHCLWNSIIVHWANSNLSFFRLSDVLACVAIQCADQKQRSNPDFLTKSAKNTLQKCVDIANEYLQAYNISAGLKSHLSCSLHQCNCAGYTTFFCICSL